MRLLLAWLGLLALGAGCEGSADLVVTLQTDLIAGQEFARATTEVRRGSRPTSRALETAALVVDPDLDFAVGQRIATLNGLETGHHSTRVVLSEGTVPIERTVLVDLVDGVNLITVLITRDCTSVTCPGPDDAPDRTACHGGVCVDPRCAPDRRSFCPDFVECEDASECTPPVPCMRVTCEEGTCLEVVDDARCMLGQRCDPVVGCTVEAPSMDAGPMPADAGPPLDGGGPACPEGSVCGPHGQVCRSGTCVCPGGPPPEGNCTDRLDGDCDGLADCEDGDCRRRVCVAGSRNRRCCGGSCVNIDANEDHCAGCGLRCAAGFSCVLRDGHPTCNCGSANAQCPNGGTGQICSSSYGVCACTGAGGCAAEQTCVDVSGGPNYCTY